MAGHQQFELTLGVATGPMGHGRAPPSLHQHQQQGAGPESALDTAARLQAPPPADASQLLALLGLGLSTGALPRGALHGLSVDSSSSEALKACASAVLTAAQLPALAAAAPPSSSSYASAPLAELFLASGLQPPSPAALALLTTALPVTISTGQESTDPAGSLSSGIVTQHQGSVLLDPSPGAALWKDGSSGSKSSLTSLNKGNQQRSPLHGDQPPLPPGHGTLLLLAANLPPPPELLMKLEASLTRMQGMDDAGRVWLPPLQTQRHAAAAPGSNTSAMAAVLAAAKADVQVPSGKHKRPPSGSSSKDRALPKRSRSAASTGSGSASGNASGSASAGSAGAAAADVAAAALGLGAADVAALGVNADEVDALEGLLLVRSMSKDTATAAPGGGGGGKACHGGELLDWGSKEARSSWQRLGAVSGGRLGSSDSGNGSSRDAAADADMAGSKRSPLHKSKLSHAHAAHGDLPGPGVASVGGPGGQRSTELQLQMSPDAVGAGLPIGLLPYGPPGCGLAGMAPPSLLPLGAPGTVLDALPVLQDKLPPPVRAPDVGTPAGLPPLSAQDSQLMASILQLLQGAAGLPALGTMSPSATAAVSAAAGGLPPALLANLLAAAGMPAPAALAAARLGQHAASSALPVPPVAGPEADAAAMGLLAQVAPPDPVALAEAAVSAAMGPVEPAAAAAAAATGVGGSVHALEEPASSHTLQRVQGQLGMLYQWYITNKNAYLEQTKHFIALLAGHGHEPGTSGRAAGSGGSAAGQGQGQGSAGGRGPGSGGGKATSSCGGTGASLGTAASPNELSTLLDVPEVANALEKAMQVRCPQMQREERLCHCRCGDYIVPHVVHSRASPSAGPMRKLLACCAACTQASPE